MSSVFVIGSHGQIGQKLVSKLIARKFVVYAGIRNDGQAKVFPTDKLVHPVHFDLNDSAEKMAKCFKQTGADTIVFSAGSGGKTGDDQTLIIDLDGAVKSMEAARIAGIKRYVMVSSVGSNKRDLWDKSGIKPYLIAKHYADKELQRTELDYTILRPGMLKNTSGTGAITVNSESEERLSIPREDVAEVIAEIVDNQATFKKSYTIGSGKTKIAAAF